MQPIFSVGYQGDITMLKGLITIFLSFFFIIPTLKASLYSAGFIRPDGINVVTSYDANSRTACIIVAATRQWGGATTKIYCYRASSYPKLTLKKEGTLDHLNTSDIVVFKVVDNANNYICFGSFIDRKGYTNSNGDRGITASGASVDLDCRIHEVI